MRSLRRRRRAAERGGPRPPRLRSIRTRLAVTFFLVTALSVAVIYVVVAAPIGSGLQHQRVKDLQSEIGAKRVNGTIRSTERELAALHIGVPGNQQRGTQLANFLSEITLGSQVNVVDVQIVTNANEPPSTTKFAAAPEDKDNPVIDHFATTVLPGQTETLAAGGLALVGIGISPATQQGSSRVVVFSAPLSDVAGAVNLVRSRILLAAALGLLVALLTGVLVARALTVRVLRLETVARRVASGDFEAHFSDSSSDELGQLAGTLAHMQSQLEGLDAARRRFIATASHELRTPIFSLGGFLELIEDEALDEETRQQFLGQVRAQVERLGKLATQLLDLTRLESGSVELSTTVTDLGVLARTVSGEFEPALAQHDSQLRLRVPEEAIRALCDSERVAQLLRILIDNAIAHTPAGTELTVSAEPADNGRGPRLAVNDNGPGIPVEALGRIFEPFYSADGARGAGLGLAIARELAVHMGAELEIDSEPGATTFTLTLATAGD